jgi:glyoxylase-like metal-dependent hydrolase (beta-lactamase superfamily II)
MAATQRRRPPAWWSILAAGLLAVPVLALAISRMWPRHVGERPAPEGDLFPLQVAAGVHAMSGLNPPGLAGADTLAYVIDAGQGLVVIDTGMDPECRSLLRQFDILGYSPQSIRAILLTHQHGDHSLGAERLRQLSGAPIYAGAGDAAALEAGGPAESFFSVFPIRDIPLHATRIDVALAQDDVIEVGDVRILAIATPGHTPGSMCYVLDRPAGERVLFGGDTVMSAQPELGTYSATLAPKYGGDAAAFLGTLDKLAALPPPDLLAPGHRREDSSCRALSASEWQRLLDDGRREMQDVMAWHGSRGADYLDGQPKEIVPGLHYLGDCEGSAVYVLAAPRGLVLFDAAGGAALVPWLEERLSSGTAPRDTIVAVALTSARAACTTALEPLVAHYGCAVVAAEDAAERVRQLCPAAEFVPPQQLAKVCGAAGLQAHPLPSLPDHAVVYTWRAPDETACLTGRVLLSVHPFALAALQTDAEAIGPPGWRATAESQLTWLGQGPRAWQAYADALDVLERLAPDVWLPAQSLNSPNANLHPGEWQQALELNESLLTRWLRDPPSQPGESP